MEPSPNIYAHFQFLFYILHLYMDTNEIIQWSNATQFGLAADVIRNELNTLITKLLSCQSQVLHCLFCFRLSAKILQEFKKTVNAPIKE